MAKQPKQNIDLQSLDCGQLCKLRVDAVELIDQKRYLIATRFRSGYGRNWKP